MLRKDSNAIPEFVQTLPWKYLTTPFKFDGERLASTSVKVKKKTNKKHQLVNNNKIYKCRSSRPLKK